MPKENLTVGEFYKKLAISSTENQVVTLKDLYRFVLDEYKAGAIDEKELAYYLVNTMQYPVVELNEYKDVALLAGELELPDGQISGDKHIKLERLLGLLNRLA